MEPANMNWIKYTDVEIFVVRCSQGAAGYLRINEVKAMLRPVDAVSVVANNGFTIKECEKVTLQKPNPYTTNSNFIFTFLSFLLVKQKRKQ